MKKLWILFIGLVCAIMLVPQSTFALGIFGIGSVGSFTGDISYSASSSTSATFTVTLKNTSPAANGGFITAFAFNNPSDLITGVSLSSTDSDFGLLGGPAFDNGISAPPLGDFDIGASITSSWLGGGSPNPGIAVGVTETFTFTLTGTGLLGLNEQSFVNELTDKGEFFGVRFRGFNDEDSDKVAGAVIPEPSTVLLLGTGLLSLACVTRFRQRKRRS